MKWLGFETWRSVNSDDFGSDPDVDLQMSQFCDERVGDVLRNAKRVQGNPEPTTIGSDVHCTVLTLNP
jgi:hypothetical protein